MQRKNPSFLIFFRVSVHIRAAKMDKRRRGRGKRAVSFADWLRN